MNLIKLNGSTLKYSDSEQRVFWHPSSAKHGLFYRQKSLETDVRLCGPNIPTGFSRQTRWTLPLALNIIH